MYDRNPGSLVLIAPIVLAALAWTAAPALTPDGGSLPSLSPQAPGPASTDDNVRLPGVAGPSELSVGFPTRNFNLPEGGTRTLVARLNRPMTDADPAEVSVEFSIESSIAEPGRDYVHEPARTLTFVNGGPPVALIPLTTLPDTKHEGTERLILRLSNPIGVAAGEIVQATVSILDDDPYDPLLVDDFEERPYLWDGGADVRLRSTEIGADEPGALPGQGAFEGVLEVEAPIHVDVTVQGTICKRGTGNGVIPVVLWSTEVFDATTVDHTTVTLGDAHEAHVDRRTGLPRRHEEDADGDGDLDLVFHFRYDQAALPCDTDEDRLPFAGRTHDGRSVTAGPVDAAFGRDFALGRDWSDHDGVKLWFYGQGSGAGYTVELLDNRAPDPGPSGWTLVWSDEFDDPAGTPPDPAHWRHEIGDGSINGIPGWGNAELEYYTDSTQNAATDGQGNLVVTAREADGSLHCYYGPCLYTSARLISLNRVELAYGRIEARILMPDGFRGLWPAFWSLGTNIGQVGWPQSGEIDIVEYVSRRPYEVYGTVHGPGYSAGESFGDLHVTWPAKVSDDWHTFAIEWQPGRIEWYADDLLYHVATPADVAPGDWVFNAPVFLIFNMAIGGYFGGPVHPTTTFPQSMAIDYIRVYQGPDTAERWETSFADDFVGWREVEIPFGAFTRSAEQPAGAPDDGLGLDEVWGYGIRLPGGGAPAGPVMLDQVRLILP